MRPIGLFAFLVVACSWVSQAYSQTVEGDILRGQGAFAAGAGWYNLNTAKGNAINVRAMRNYNEEVRQNMNGKMKHWQDKDATRDLTVEQAKKRAQERMKQIRENPTADDIRSGDALNMLTVVLTDPSVKQQDWYAHAVALPEQASVKNIVFCYYPNRISAKDLKIDVAISRLGTGVDWPVAFTAEAFADERMAYEESAANVKASILKGKFEPKEMKALDNSLESLLAEVNRTYAGEKNGFLSKGKEFHAELKDATKLFNGGVADYAKELLAETEKHDARTVGELVAFMLKYRLFFAPANSPKSIELYSRLYSSLKDQSEKLGFENSLELGSVHSINGQPELERAASTKPAVKVDLLPVHSEWIGQRNTGEKQTFTVIERNGDSFRARLKVGKDEREITGTIRGELIAWNKEDIKVLKGSAIGPPNQGKILPDGTSYKMDLVWHGEKGKTGAYTLRRTNQ